MEIEKIQEKFIDKLKPSGWYETGIWNLINSPQFCKAYRRVMEQVYTRKHDVYTSI